MKTSFGPCPAYSLQADCTLRAQGAALALCASPRHAGQRQESTEQDHAPSHVSAVPISPRKSSAMPPGQPLQEHRHWSKHDLFRNAISNSGQFSGRTLWTTLRGPHNNQTGLVGPQAQSYKAEQHEMQDSRPPCLRSRQSPLAGERKLPRWALPSRDHKPQSYAQERQKLHRDLLLQGKGKVAIPTLC